MLQSIKICLKFGGHSPTFTSSFSPRISHQNLSRVIWQSSVHSWEVELYQDVVFRDLENDQLSRLKKRPAPNEEQTPAKRRKASTEGIKLLVVQCWFLKGSDVLYAETSCSL